MEVLSTAIKQEKEIKCIQFGRKELKLSLFADVIILYLGNHKISTKKLLEPINVFSKGAGYKTNISKFAVFISFNNKLSER